MLAVFALTFFVPNNNLYSWNSIRYEYLYSFKMHLVKNVIITDGLDSLDFSESDPKIEVLNLHKNSSLFEDFTFLAKDDSGLSNNINLKTIMVWNEYPQIPISLSYLPHVERYEVSWSPLNNFAYLSDVLPSLKSLYFDMYARPRDSMAACFENISKLEFLENLEINTHDKFWGDSLTKQEIDALSKMYNLKTLTFQINGVESNHKGSQLSLEKLQILRDLLPNTDIKVIIRYYAPQDY